MDKKIEKRYNKLLKKYLKKNIGLGTRKNKKEAKLLNDFYEARFAYEDEIMKDLNEKGQ